MGCFLLFQLRGIKRCARHSCEKTVGNLCDSAVPVAGLPDSDIPEVWKKKKKKTEEEEEEGGGVNRRSIAVFNLQGKVVEYH